MSKNTKQIVLAIIAAIFLVVTVATSISAISTGKTMNQAKSDYVQMAKQNNLSMGSNSLEANLESKQKEVNEYKEKLFKLFAFSIISFLIMILDLAGLYFVIVKEKVQPKE